LVMIDRMEIMEMQVRNLITFIFRLSSILLCFMVVWSSTSASAVMVKQRERVGAEAGLTDFDFNDDGYINQHDLDILKLHFNERYAGYVPWDLNADLRCDYRDFYYFADHVPLNYRFQVAVNITVWNLSNYTIERGIAPALILGETVYPQNPNRVLAWIKQCTSLEPPKNNSAICVHYARDLCRLAYKELGPKTIAWGSSGIHAYGMIYTGGDWRELSNWCIIDPYLGLYNTVEDRLIGLHNTRTIEILLDKGRYGYWAIHLDVDYKNNTIYDAYKAEYRMRKYREP